MKLPAHPANPGLAALIAGSGFTSLERFAVAVNHRGWHMHGIKTSYDHVTVKRWLAGSVCQYPEVVAAVLSDAWGVDVPEAVIWPQLRDGKPPVPTHLSPWAAARTLEGLALFVRSDMLTRRETLTSAVTVASGAALLTPLERWLGVPPGRIAPRTDGTERIGTADVAAIERSTRYFAGTDAAAGGALSREAAVGQLKYAVDLARHASYSDPVGNRLLAAIAELSGLVGWLCLDSKMPGPAHRYLLYALQAARESTDPRARTLVVTLLTDLAQLMRWQGRPNTALRLVDLAVSQLPADRSRFTILRAIILTKRVEEGLCHLGPSAIPEVRNTLNLSAELHAEASDEERTTARDLWHRTFDTSTAHFSSMAAAAYLELARDDHSLTTEVERRTLHHLANGSEGQGRNKVFSQIRLAKVRFLAGEPEQAIDDGNRALDLAEDVTSALVGTRLRELLADTGPYAGLPEVVEFRERVRATLRGARDSRHN